MKLKDKMTPAELAECLNLARQTINRWAREQKWHHPERHFDFYMNTLNFGGGVIGIEAASQYYFNKSSFELNSSEAEMLAGLYKSFTEL